MTGRAYAQTRNSPAPQASFVGSHGKSWIQQEQVRVSLGYIMMLSGKPSLPCDETNRRLQMLDSTCAFNAFGFKFDPAKWKRLRA